MTAPLRGEPGGRLLVSGRRSALEVDCGSLSPDHKRYTLYCASPRGDILEEIDVDATDREIALELGELVLSADYESGLRVVAIEERFGLYL